MRIIVLNGSPHPKGNTKQMVDAFREGAESAGSLFPAGGGRYACHCLADLLSRRFRAVKVYP